MFIIIVKLEIQFTLTHTPQIENLQFTLIWCPVGRYSEEKQGNAYEMLSTVWAPSLPSLVPGFRALWDSSCWPEVGREKATGHSGASTCFLDLKANVPLTLVCIRMTAKLIFKRCSGPLPWDVSVAPFGKPSLFQQSVGGWAPVCSVVLLWPCRSWWVLNNCVVWWPLRHKPHCKHD